MEPCDCPSAYSPTRRLVFHTLTCLRKRRGDKTLDQYYGKAAGRAAKGSAYYNSLRYQD